MIKLIPTRKNADPDNPRALISRDDLEALGRKEVGYIRCYTVKGQHSFVLHAADGTALAMQKNMQDIRHSADRQSLNLVSLH